MGIIIIVPENMPIRKYSGECGKADKGHCFRPCMLAVNVSAVVVDTGRLLFMVL